MTKTKFKFYVLFLPTFLLSFALNAMDEEDVQKRGVDQVNKLSTQVVLDEVSEPLIDALDKKQETKKDWRKNWFVQNILFEIPIFGDCFCSPDVKVVLQRMGKSTVMLVGGTVGMMLYIVDPSDNCMSSNMNMNSMSMNHNNMSQDNMALQGVEMAVNMAIGMTASNILYNASLKGCCFFYKKFKERCNPVDQEIL